MTFMERAKALVAQMTLEEKMTQMKYNAPAIGRQRTCRYSVWQGISQRKAACQLLQIGGRSARI